MRAPNGTYGYGLDVDEVAVERCASGQLKYLSLNIAERVEVVRQLNAEGCSDPAIAERCGCAAMTVLRLRQRYGIAPVTQATWRRPEVA